MLYPKRKDDVDIYKHEQESMRRSYIENYYNAMDTVIQLLDNSQTVPSWKETRYKKMLDVLKNKEYGGIRHAVYDRHVLSVFFPDYTDPERSAG